MEERTFNANSKKLVVFLVLVYAYLTRSIFARYIFGTQIQLWIFYLVTFLLLFCGLLTSFKIYKVGPHIYAPRGFFEILLITLVIAVGLSRASDMNTLLYYGLALLLPFSIRKNDDSSLMPIKAIIIMGIIATFGSLLNYLFPSIYSASISYFFNGNTLSALQWLINEGSFYPGIYSQVNYTAFFIGIAIGALFAFRKVIFRRNWILLLLFLFFGMLLTGKRGAFVYCFVSLIIIFLLEGNGIDEIKRLFGTIGLIVAAYVLLNVIANYSGISSIQRICNAVNEFIINGSIEDVGRNQLHNQAWKYFYDSPVCGIGWGNFRKFFTLRNTYVHCIYLQLLCETGIIGAGIFFTFFASLLLRTIVRYKKQSIYEGEHNGWLKLSIFIQIYFLLFGVTENPLYDIEEFILYMYAIGLYYYTDTSASNL